MSNSRYRGLGPSNSTRISPSNIINPEISTRLTRRRSAASSSGTATHNQPCQSTSQPDAPGRRLSAEITAGNVVDALNTPRLTRRGSAEHIFAMRTPSTRQDQRHDPMTRKGRTAWKKDYSRTRRKRVRFAVPITTAKASDLMARSSSPDGNDMPDQPDAEEGEDEMMLDPSNEQPESSYTANTPSQSARYNGVPEIYEDPSDTDSDSSAGESNSSDKENMAPTSDQDRPASLQKLAETSLRELQNIHPEGPSNENAASTSVTARPAPPTGGHTTHPVSSLEPDAGLGSGLFFSHVGIPLPASSPIAPTASRPVYAELFHSTQGEPVVPPRPASSPSQTQSGVAGSYISAFPSAGTLAATRRQLYESRADPPSHVRSIPTRAHPNGPKAPALIQYVSSTPPPPPLPSPSETQSARPASPIRRKRLGSNGPLDGSDISLPLPETPKHPWLVVQPPSPDVSSASTRDPYGKLRQLTFQPEGASNLMVRNDRKGRYRDDGPGIWTRKREREMREREMRMEKEKERSKTPSDDGSLTGSPSSSSRTEHLTEEGSLMVQELIRKLNREREERKSQREEMRRHREEKKRQEEEAVRDEAPCDSVEISGPAGESSSGSPSSSPRRTVWEILRLTRTTSQDREEQDSPEGSGSNPSGGRRGSVFDGFFRPRTEEERTREEHNRPQDYRRRFGDWGW
ncbi:MAG: hypothetical protein Q9225_004293 [Loekoesia sp. 1 TL-2023]